MPINTVYQLLVDDRVGDADRIALVPDLLAYWLCGELANERTNASTTGLLDARTGEWSLELIERLGLPTQAVPRPGRAGHAARPRAPEFDAPVYTVASHDTASAYVAAPICAPSSAILSSGTWSLLGLELDGPVFSDDALTNERGIDGTIRLLKNVMGLWLEQECARVWDADFPALQHAAREATDARADLRRRRRALPARRRHARADRRGRRPRARPAARPCARSTSRCAHATARSSSGSRPPRGARSTPST